jgi:hypothetical protein
VQKFPVRAVIVTWLDKGTKLYPNCLAQRYE